MKSTKKLIRLICLCLPAVLILSLTGCFSSGGGYYDYNYNDNNAMLTEADLISLIQQEWDDSISEDQPVFLSSIDSRSNFEYIDYTFDGASTYTIHYNVSSPDISSLLFSDQYNSDQNNMSNDELNNELINMINAAEIKTTEQVVYVFVSQTTADDPQEIDIKFTDGFIDAMFCYSYISATNAIIEDESRMWEDF